MNIAVIFAGGVGSRMHGREKPKQFLEMYNKPIIIHTIERFENHPLIDSIVVVCIKDWIPHLEHLLYKFRIEKVGRVVPGGKTGQLSIYNGLCLFLLLFLRRLFIHCFRKYSIFREIEDLSCIGL